jgi:hypothetical protein
MAAQRDERPLGQLFADFSRQLSTLVRKEIDLARTEMTGRARVVARDSAMVGVGGALLYAALLVLLAAVTLLLVSIGLTAWVAALVVAIVVGVIGAVLVQRGRAGIEHADFTPRQTIETLREDADWAKERVK